MISPREIRDDIKCVVHGCGNRKGEGGFVGDLCAPCHYMITTGIVGHGETFVHQNRDQLAAANKIVAEQSAALGRAHAAKVYVVMGNDYPNAVFRDENKAKKYCAAKKAKNMPGERIIYWRHYEFEVQT